MNNNLLHVYESLSPAHKIIIGVKALIGYVGWPAKLFYGLVTAAGCKDDDGKLWTPLKLVEATISLQLKNLLDGSFFVPQSILHRVTLDIVESPHGNLFIKLLDERTDPGSSNYNFSTSMNTHTIRKLRLSIYTNDEHVFKKLYEIYEQSYHPATGPHILEDLLLTNHLDVDWLIKRSPLIRYSIFIILLNAFSVSGQARSGFVPLLNYYSAHTDSLESNIYNEWTTDLHTMRGDTNAMRRCVATTPPFNQLATQATINFFTGNNGLAMVEYRESLKQLRQHTRKRKIFFADSNGVFFLLAMLASGDASLYVEMASFLDMVPLEETLIEGAFMAVRAMLCLVQGQENQARTMVKNGRAAMPGDPLSAACITLAEYFIDKDASKKNIPFLEERISHLREIVPLVAHIFACVLANHQEMPPPPSPWIDFTTIIAMRQTWERSFDALNTWMNTNKPRGPERETTTAGKRLAWFVDLKLMAIADVLEQSHRARQGWSDGRSVALKRLYEQDPRLNYLTDQDRRALRTMRKKITSWTEDYFFDDKETLLALIGHPAVFDAHIRTRFIELVAYPLELVVSGTRKGFRFALSRHSTVATTFIQEESTNRYRVIEFSEKHLALQQILGKNGLEVPREARQQVIDLIQQQGLPLPLLIEVAGLDGTSVEGDSTPVLQLRPLEQGLRCTLHVRPFGPKGPSYQPGQGNRSILATLAGEQKRANRNLEAEKKAINLVLNTCPLLAEMLNGEFVTVVEGLESCLEMLLQIGESPHPLVVEWPEGKPLKVYQPVSAKQLTLSVKQSRDWFHVEGKLAVDQGQMVAMQQILAGLDHASGRFIPLDDGRFITLTNHFRQQLETFRTISESSRDGCRLAPLATLAIEDLLEESGEVMADAAWQNLGQRIRQANDHNPLVPSTLQAELRDYQVEGFCWLSRLARWGAGACLADDMGLGKTVQAIAILLEQGVHGPSLVVAPTSVCHNWERELARFAPSLQVYRLSAVADRPSLLASLGPMAVLVVSYGLLQGEEEGLAAIHWQVIILDEAQAIKNAETRRAQASRKLTAAFRLALSGTPIENYLDELWSLFQFINPNLLGSRESFQKRFATPIEKYKDTTALHALRSLVRPFILRRTKSMVLTELPPRTDVTLEVELPADERAFQEAVRQQALLALENISDDNPLERRFRILAEITRLRRACCHPALIDPNSQLAGAKLTLFLELVEELIRNRHKVLVFSQFVTLLDLVRPALDRIGIHYQYLDGSTSIKEREKRVTAFQGGEGDLFLISLKAGGLGLNLTAADYVIHLDPWWNPAVEDQASDRAHRMGQKRPVTVYRMIIQGSIEEKMVRLHQDKRELADALLEGTGSTVRLAEEDLLALLRS